MKSTKESPAIKVADEVWIATALLHRENPKREDFSVSEIVARARRENLSGRIVVPLIISGPAKAPAVNVDTKRLVTRGLKGILQDRGKGSPLDRLFRGR
jgi:hypothetical protein